MYEIVKVLLEKGIEEDTIHEVLDVISENVFQAIQKSPKSEEEKQKLMQKAFDNQHRELEAAAEREKESGKEEYPGQAKGKSKNKIIYRRNPVNKQAMNIVKRGVAQIEAGEGLQKHIENKEESLGTQYATDEKKKLANKLINLGTKRTKMGFKQAEGPLSVLYADGKRTIKYEDK